MRWDRRQSSPANVAREGRQEGFNQKPLAELELCAKFCPSFPVLTEASRKTKVLAAGNRTMRLTEHRPIRSRRKTSGCRRRGKLSEAVRGPRSGSATNSAPESKPVR